VLRGKNKLIKHTAYYLRVEALHRPPAWAKLPSVSSLASPGCTNDTVEPDEFRDECLQWFSC
jgi:hypothetical protein